MRASLKLHFILKAVTPILGEWIQQITGRTAEISVGVQSRELLGPSSFKSEKTAHRGKEGFIYSYIHTSSIHTSH